MCSLFLSSSTLLSCKCDQGIGWSNRGQSGWRALAAGWTVKHKAQDPDSSSSDLCRSLSCFSFCFSFQIIHHVRTSIPITVQPLLQSPCITSKKLTICLLSSFCKQPQKELWRNNWDMVWGLENPEELQFLLSLPFRWIRLWNYFKNKIKNLSDSYIQCPFKLHNEAK